MNIQNKLKHFNKSFSYINIEIKICFNQQNNFTDESLIIK